MQQQNYWKVFERTGSVADYLHYVACVENGWSAREELAAGIAEEDNVVRAVAENSAIASSAMATGVPLLPETTLMSGSPLDMGSSATLGAVLLGQKQREKEERKQRDSNP